MAEELEENPKTELLRALEASDCSALLAAAEDIHYADLANLYENLDDEKRDLFLKTIGPELATDVVAELPYPLIEGALNHFKPAQLRVLLGNLSDDDRVDVFQVVSKEAQVRFFSLLGPRVPASLRLFLLTVAIVDDLGAVAIIALVYTASIDWAWLGLAAVALGAMVALNWMRVPRAWPYILAGVALWFAVLHSGVHATVAGVLAALCVPLRLKGQRDSMLLRMEHAMAPVSAYFIVPLFGFANAGVHLPSGDGPGFYDALPLAVALGLFVGKQAGIFGAVVAAERLGFAVRPVGASTAQLWGISLLCGIGFTMSLFIAQLAFPGDLALVEEAKLGVILGSTAAALAGYAVLFLAGRKRAA